MDLKTYLSGLGGEAGAFAERCGTSLGHLRNVVYGFRTCSPTLAVRIERESKGVVTRPELRDDWADQWPELVVPAEQEG